MAAVCDLGFRSMTTHTDIEWVKDDAWLAAMGGSERSAFLATSAKRLLVMALAGGPYKDSSGRTTALLYERMKQLGYKHNQTGLAGLLGEPWVRYAVERDMNGKRTYRIELKRLPERWATWLPADPPAVEPATVEAPPVEAPPVAPDVDWERFGLTPPEEVEAGLGSLRLVVAESVATALLSKCLAVLSTAAADATAIADRDDARRRLANALEESDRNRRRANEAGEELRATKQERDGLRQRLRQVEANLERLTSANGDVGRMVDELVHVELDKVMRATPRNGR